MAYSSFHSNFPYPNPYLQSVALALPNPFNSYTTETEEEGYFRSEFRYGKFQRLIPLPIEIQHEQVKAEFKDGSLSLTLPKREQAKVVKLNLAELSGNSTSTIEAANEPSSQVADSAESKVEATV